MDGGNKKNILLVEDAAIIALATKKELERRGYQVHHVPTGEKALEAVTNHDLQVDLILMDIDLGPGIDGTQTAERILAHKDIPIVFLSSHTEPEVVEKTEKITSYGYVVKSSGIVVLDVSIKMALKLFQAKMNEKIKDLALRESEERFKALHSASCGGIAIHDKGIILECNQGLSDMTGYNYDELIGMNGLLLIAPQDRDLVMNNIMTAYEKPYEANGICKNGKQFPMRLEARNIPYKGKNVRTVEFRDLTESRQSLEELRRSEELLNAGERLSNIGGWEWHNETQTMYWTEEIYRIHDFEPGEIEAGSAEHVKRSMECYDTEGRPKLQAAFKRCVENGEPYDLELPFTSAKGRLLWIRTCARPIVENGKVNRIIGNIMDITVQKQAEVKISELAERLRLAKKQLMMLSGTGTSCRTPSNGTRLERWYLAGPKLLIIR